MNYCWHAALEFLQGRGPDTPNEPILVGLHQGLLVPDLIRRVLEAKKRGAHLGRGVRQATTDLQALVRDPAFDWGESPAEGSAAGAGSRHTSESLERAARAAGQDPAAGHHEKPISSSTRSTEHGDSRSPADARLAVERNTAAPASLSESAAKPPAEPATMASGLVASVSSTSPTTLADIERATKYEQFQTALELLTHGDRVVLASSDNAAMRRIVKAYAPGDLLNLFGSFTPPFQPHWMIFYIDVGRNWSLLESAQWSRLLGLVGAQGLAEIRANAEAFNCFIRKAPSDLIPPWDLLVAAASKKLALDAGALRDAVASLAPSQRARLLTRNDILEALMPLTQWALVPTMRALGLALSDQIRWVKKLGAYRLLDSRKWIELLVEAPRAELDAVMADPVLWRLVERNCDPIALQTVKDATTSPAAGEAAFDDPAQLDSLFQKLGAVAFLSLATNATRVKYIYDRIKVAGKVMPTLESLPKGTAMSPATAAGLRRWMLETGENDLKILYEMFERRFRIKVGLQSKVLSEMWEGNAVLGDFTPEQLRMSWPILERLPPRQIMDNSSLRTFLADVGARVGNAGFWRDTVVLGVAPPRNSLGGAAPMNRSVPDSQHVYWRKDEKGNLLKDRSGKPIPVDMRMPLWNATLRHEIGHAVDTALGLTQTSDLGVAAERHAGSWKGYASYESFVDALIVANGGMRSGATWDASKDARYRRVMIEALRATRPFLEQLMIMHPTDERADVKLNAGAIAAVWTTDRWADNPWYFDSWVRIGGRCWQRAYARESSLFSFESAAKEAHGVTQYQWRAPAEWFAEAYQVYYAEQEKGPEAPVGALLRTRDTQAADLISGRVDSGYSPQDMRGGKKMKSAGAE